MKVSYNQGGWYDGDVSILKQASADMRKRLLELYPVANLRKEFGQKGSKEEISSALASSSDTQQLAAIADFVDENASFCKQHVYVFSHTGDAVLPSGIPHGELVKAEKDHAFYLVRIEYGVVKLDPLEHGSIEFLWPIRIDLHQNYLLIRFVVLEKNIGSYFDRAVLLRGKSLSEETITSSVLADGTMGLANLNKGFKALWQKDKIDAARVKYKKPGSVVIQSMDEEKGLKQFDTPAYEELQKLPLYQSIFISYRGFTEVGAFTADPTNGFIGFTRYFKEGASGDELIRQILANN